VAKGGGDGSQWTIRPEVLGKRIETKNLQGNTGKKKNTWEDGGEKGQASANSKEVHTYRRGDNQKETSSVRF